MKKWMPLLFGVSVVLLLNCCAMLRSPACLEEPKDPDQSLVVGYLDMSDAHTHLKFIHMNRLRPTKGWYSFGVNEDIFFNDLVKPGVYQFDKFGSSNATYYFPVQGKKEMDPDIKKPGIYFVGPYKLKIVKHMNMFEHGEFELIKIDKPTEKEVLEKLLEYAGETIWRQRILRRMEELE